MSENVPDNIDFEPDDLPDEASADMSEEPFGEDFEDEAEESSEDDSGGTPILTILIIAVLALIICAGAAAIFFLFFGDRGDDAQPTLAPTAAVPEIQPTVAEPSEGVDPVWDRIQESGTLLVGTSADYPPFEYYNENFQVDGFDVALIKEIGQSLGLEVDISDMAFDGLGGALRVNQIDVAISAITFTEERDKSVDFSHTYFISEDAVVANGSSQITLTSADDLVNYRLGVQAGTIYENFAQTALVETGKMPEHNLFVYQEMGRALDDLAAERIDLVAMDLAPAETAVEGGEFKIVSVGFTRQQIAMAIPQDSFKLQSELNIALAQLQADGRVAELIQEYFDVDPGEIPPVPTPDPGNPTPTPPPDPPAGCIDAMQWVADLSYDDNGLTDIQSVPPGTAFQKGWRLLNTGTCTWDSTYLLVPVRGNVPAARMGGVPTPVQGTVAPGQTYDMWVDLTAPIDPGTYIEYWTMRNTQGVLFGDVIWVAITVPAAATPTPVATQTPSPSASFTADPEVIDQGQCSTLTWTSENVQAVYVYPQGEDWRNYGVPGTGTQTVCPSETTTYEMRVVKTDGTTEIRRVTVSVVPNAEAPKITRFTVEPPYSVTVGQCVVITWAVEGNVSTVNIARNDVVIWPNAPFSGNMQDCIQTAGQYVYKLDASGSGGNSVASQTIQVVPLATATPIPTTPPEQPTNTPLPPATSTPPPEPTPIPDPVIYSFSATPSEVETGQCTTVGWSVGGNTSLVQILKNGAVVLDDASLRDSAQDCDLNQAATVTYEVRASNNTGGQASDQATVTVHESKPDNPLANTSWQLVGYLAGGQMTPVLDGTTVGISYHEDLSYGGHGGCNGYGGTYTVNGSQITMSAPSGTQIACEEAVTQQENTYFSLLPTAAGYQISNGQLTITDGSGQTILQYSQIVATPL